MLTGQFAPDDAASAGDLLSGLLQDGSEEDNDNVGSVASNSDDEANLSRAPNLLAGTHLHRTITSPLPSGQGLKGKVAHRWPAHPDS